MGGGEGEGGEERGRVVRRGSLSADECLTVFEWSNL